MLRKFLRIILLAECLGLIPLAIFLTRHDEAQYTPVIFDKTYFAVRAKRDIPCQTEITADDVEDFELSHNINASSINDNFHSSISACYRNTKRQIKKGEVLTYSDTGVRTAPKFFPDPDHEIY